jgi:hypothetical protein
MYTKKKKSGPAMTAYGSLEPIDKKSSSSSLKKNKKTTNKINSEISTLIYPSQECSQRWGYTSKCIKAFLVEDSVAGMPSLRSNH